MNVARVILALLFFSLTAHAQVWRPYAGGFSSSWNTRGHHGHDHDTCELDCDVDDFDRANLDDSIGFRAGVERDFWSAGALRFLAGGDASISHTEYNTSQRDLSLFGAVVFAGADLDLHGIRVGARYGAGGYATTRSEHSGVLRFTELAAMIPLRSGASVRIAKRSFALTRMHAAPSREISIALVNTAGGDVASAWEFTAATGTTMPGAGSGGDRKLRSTALNRTNALRSLGARDFQLELSWTSTAHESSLPSTFLGYDGNFRSKTIEGYGLALSRVVAKSRPVSWRWSAGVEVADWRDEHRLLTRDGEELVAGVEVALTAGAAMRVQLEPHLALETSLQKVYWRDLDLGEVRWTAGIVLTR